MTETCEPQLSELLELKMELVMLVSFLRSLLLGPDTRVPPTPPTDCRLIWFRDLAMEFPTSTH